MFAGTSSYRSTGHRVSLHLPYSKNGESDKSDNFHYFFIKSYVTWIRNMIASPFTSKTYDFIENRRGKCEYIMSTETFTSYRFKFLWNHVQGVLLLTCCIADDIVRIM